MRSTGEVMGIAKDFATAFAKSQAGASSKMPLAGTVFISVALRDRQAVLPVARKLAELGYHLMSTSGTGAVLSENGIEVTTVRKIQEGRPNLLDYMANGQIAMIVNTPSGKGARTDEGRIRASAVSHGVTCITTINGAKAAVAALEKLRQGPPEVYAIQDVLAGLGK
jgi:carbamoyl-phosphate synthase large subunit